MQPSTYINSDSFFDYLRNDDALITYVILFSNFFFSILRFVAQSMTKRYGIIKNGGLGDKCLNIL